jgi:hypothetical protein
VPIKTTSQDDNVIALLYGLHDLKGGGLAVGFSAWVMGRHPSDQPWRRLRYAPIGSQKWFWTIGNSFDQMLAEAGAGYDKSTATLTDYMKARGSQVFPRSDYLQATAHLSLFFLAACAWMQQRIPVLTLTPGHIERHRRKQLHREQRLDAPPNDVKIVQLRRLEARPHEPSSGDGPPVDWSSCRWPVDGHFRNQPCGSKHGDRRLIWIMPYVKGPADKPLKVPAHKIFVVNR